MTDKDNELYQSVMDKLPSEILDFNVESLTNGSVVLSVNKLSENFYAFTWIFDRNQLLVLVKAAHEIAKKLLPENQRVEA